MLKPVLTVFHPPVMTRGKAFPSLLVVGLRYECLLTAQVQCSRGLGAVDCPQGAHSFCWPALDCKKLFRGLEITI